MDSIYSYDTYCIFIVCICYGPSNLIYLECGKMSNMIALNFKEGEGQLFWGEFLISILVLQQTGISLRQLLLQAGTAGSILFGGVEGFRLKFGRRNTGMVVLFQDGSNSESTC